MTGKYLGKITSAEFGKVRDYPFLIGLQLGFEMTCGQIADGGKYTVNISRDCRWESKERAEVITAVVEHVDKILTDAKVRYVSELKNKPVEVTVEGNAFKDFRILTEVL